jgi:hypothetical protein
MLLGSREVGRFILYISQEILSFDDVSFMFGYYTELRIDKEGGTKIDASRSNLIKLRRRR